MSHHLDDAVRYINQHRAQEISDQQIRDHMTKHGWTEHWVDQAFMHAAKSPTSHHHSPAPHAKKKYKVLNAVGDSWSAIRKNLLTLILTSFISMIFAFATALILFAIIEGISLTSNDLENFNESPTAAWSIIVTILVLITLWYSIAYSFMMSCAALAIWDGSQGHKSSVSSVLKRALKASVRVAGANALFFVLMYWPIILMVLLPLIVLTVGVHWSVAVISLVATTAWLVMILLRYPLAPYVVLFEPNVTIWKSLKRSKHLLVNGGQWFLVKGALLVILIVLVLCLVGDMTIVELMDSDNMLVNLALLILTVFIEACLVMLYKNRRIVRG